MKTDVSTDRRRGRRVDARLQIELQLEPGGPSHPASTINISSNGVYFKSPRFVAPLTKLGLRLLLPEDETGEETSVDCQGVVVRCLPEKPTAGVQEYEVACYFPETSPEFQARVGHYVTRSI